MNKLLYRIIFSKTRSIMIVVADIAPGISAGKRRRRQGENMVIKPFRIPLLRLALWLASGLVSLPSYATIIADNHAPGDQQATILSTANGLPQINIQTPNEQGISRNQYQQFDVDNRGVILNNSQHITQTQLAGQITGNPWLAKQEARIIINEVNSSDLSQLNGFIEVAGRRAEVIIANPSGITCNGCGFINAEQASLVAGQARIEEGKLKGFDVNGGRINITGQGMNAGETDYTRLIARAVNINAKVQTKGDLTLTVGRNKTDAKGNVTQIKPSSEATSPVFALDVAVLGGMYANKIVLEGTEMGVGVRNAGELGAMVGELSLNINGELVNRGQISGKGSLSGNVNQDIDNSGSLTAGGNIQLSTPASLHNTGRIRSNQDVHLTAAMIDSTPKSVLAAGTDNQGITGPQGSLQLTAFGELKAQGQNLAGNNLQATARRIDFTGSKTQARTVMLTATQQDISTVNAVVRGSDSINIKAARLDNQQGVLQAGATLSLNINDAVDNPDTHQLSVDNLVMPATKLDSKQRGIPVVGDEQLTQDNKGDNTVDLLKSHESMPVINHRHTTVQPTVLNMRGFIFSQDSLQVEGASLDINNQAGTLIAVKDAHIHASSLSGDGQVLSKGRLAVLLEQDFHNIGTVKANDDISFTTLGQVINEGNFAGLQGLALNARDITNHVQGNLSAKEMHLSARNTLNNTGLIDGGLAHLQASTINNQDSGRIFGDHVAIAAEAVNNLKSGDKAPVIAAQQRLDIGASTLNNRDHAHILSQGDIAIGGALDTRYRATGQGEILHNHGALIEAGAETFINMQKVKNTNRNLVTQTVQVEKSRYHEAVLKGQKTRYPWAQVNTRHSDKYGVHTAQTPDGKYNDEFYEYNYLRTVDETQIKYSEPGKILSTQNLTFNTTYLANQDSQIVAGGSLGGNIGTLDNQATRGERITNDRGWITYWFAKKESRRWGGTKTSQGKDNYPHRPKRLNQTIDLKAQRWQENTVPEVSSIHVDRYQTPEVSLMTEILCNETSADKEGHLVLIRTLSPENLLPDNMLFTLHPGTDSHYLVETAQRFVNKKQWLTSDYMQNMFTVEHSNTHKRLGDGYYEQKLIRDQLVQLTGHRYLGNHKDDESQYLALMNSGISFGKSYQLQPGVALTPPQMALLTTDIVWLVDRKVRLADGSTQKVRVPQVYAKLGNNDLTVDGALLGGKNLTLSAYGNITNSGNIRGKGEVRLTAQNLTHSGNISGDRLSLQVRNDIHNRGGQIGAESAVSLMAGHNIDSRSATQTEGIISWTARQAGIYVNNAAGILTLNALNNITLAGSDINNYGPGGYTHISAGNNLLLETVSAASVEDNVWDSGWRYLTQQTETGSRITTDGPLTLEAGQDIRAIAADVSAGTELIASAQRDIRLTAGNAITYLSESHRQDSNGLLTDISTESYDELNERQALSTTLTGNTVVMESGRDLSLSGSHVVGSQDVSLNASRHLSVSTAAESRHEFHLREETKSGLMGSGGIGFTIGDISQKVTTDQTAHLNLGSVVGSKEGNTRLQASHQAIVQGSDVISGNDLAIVGNNVSITAAENNYSAVTKYEQKQSGLTIALSGTVGSALNTATSTLMQARKEDDKRLIELQKTKAALSGVQAFQAYQYDKALTEAANAKNENKAANTKNGHSSQGATNTVGISASYGSQSSKSETRTDSRQSQGSTLATGKNLVVHAHGQHQSTQNGDIAITGSHLKAGSDISLNAMRDIPLYSALNSESTHSKNSSKGGNLGVGIGVGSGGYGINISAGINASKGHENGNGVTHTITTLEAGNRLNLASGRDVTLKGTQASGKTITANVGRNLTLQSEQESNRYDARQQGLSAGGSFSFGSMTGSAYISASQDKLNSNFDSVKQQTGLFAGTGGYGIKVKEHTRLDGAVLASHAAAPNNNLDTSTLSWSDIQNQADYSSEHIGVSFSSGGSVGQNLLTNMTGGLLLGGNKTRHAEGTTLAAISEGGLTIRDNTRQQQNIAQLNRATDLANAGSLSPIFDKEKEQKQLRQAHLVSEVVGQALDIYHTHEATKAIRTATQTQQDNKKWQALQNLARDILNEDNRKNILVDNGPQAVKERAWQMAYDAALTQQGAQMGGNVRMSVHAVARALQVLADGNIQAALAHGAAPFLAAQIKNITTDGKAYSELSNQDKLNNLVAHAILGGVIAELSHGNALAGATGAVTGELAAPAIALTLYGTAESTKLTSQQKENLSSLATLASGIAAGVSSDNTAGAVAGAQTGKNAVENNYLRSKQIDAWSAEMKTCQVSGGDCGGIIKKYEELSTAQQKQLISDCAASPASCQQKYGDVLTDSLAVKQAIDRALGEDIPIKMVYDLTATFAHQIQAEGVVATNKVSEALQKEYGLDEVQAGVVASAAASAFGGISKYQPNKGAVGNMNELLKQPGFGNQIKNKAQKSSQQYQGQTVYKATNDIGSHIKKGDQFYLDGQHKDHLEVFDKRGDIRAVLNLDGTVNKSKTEAAKGRKL